MNLLDYKIDWKTYSKFDRQAYLEKYFFCHVSYLLISKLHDSANFIFDDYSSELLDMPEPIDSNDRRINRAIKLCLSYLEKYCHYDKILREIREEFNKRSYSEFTKTINNGSKDRLKQIIFNSILILNKLPITVRLSKFNDLESRISPEKIDSYLVLKNHYPLISKYIAKYKNEPYTQLLDIIKGDKKNIRAKQRIELDKEYSLDKGIVFDSFTSPSKEYQNDSNLPGISYNFSQTKIPRTFQLVSVFDISEFHQYLQLITEALIKLGVLSEMISCFRTEEIYRPHYFSVKGPQDAVDKYGSWLISRYDLSGPGDLSRKIESMCFEDGEKGSKGQLNRESIMRAILRRGLFT